MSTMQEIEDLVKTLAMPESILCPTCGHNVTVVTNSSQGTIMRLPNMSDIPSDSYVFQNRAMRRKGAYNHPTLTFRSSCCQHLVFCLEMTSFGRRGAAAKFLDKLEKGQEFDLKEHIALNEFDTVPHNFLGQLCYEGPRMEAQTYVKLSSGYWIEPANLQSWFDDSDSQPHLLSGALGLLSVRWVEAAISRDTTPAKKSKKSKNKKRTAKIPIPARCSEESPVPFFVLPKLGNHAVAIKAPTA